MEFIKATELEPPSTETIRKFEENHRIRLPSTYLNLLRTGNGAIPIKHRFFQYNRERLIERMLCILDNPNNDNKNGWYDIGVIISQINERLVDNPDIVGTNVIPIAALFGGDFLCLDYRNNIANPNISVWEHEKSDIFQPYLEKIANSLPEFETLLVNKI